MAEAGLNPGDVPASALGRRLFQSRGGSLSEAAVNVLAGYVLALLVQAIVYPLFGIETSLLTNNALAAIFTAVSLLRSYLVRRAFERMAISRELLCVAASPSRPGSN